MDPTDPQDPSPAGVEAATFRTKTGECHVTPDRLSLLRTGPRGKLADTVQGRSRARTVGLYAVFVVCMAVLATSAWRADRPVAALMWFGYAAWVVVALARSRDFSVATEIPRPATTRIDVVRGWKGLTRDRLVVHFTDDGRPARRFILLSGVLQGGSELDRAVTALRDAGWPVRG